MTEQEIVDKVKAILNELGEESNLPLLSEDTVKIEAYIKSVIPDAVSLIQLNSPVKCVNKKSASSTEKLIPDSEGICMIKLPDDFISLRSARLSSWKKVCINAFSMDSEEYKRQCNQYTKSGIHKPICVIGYNNLGEKTMFLYSTLPSTSPTLDIFVYEASYKLGNLNLDKNDPIAMSVCYMAASLVYSIFENKNASESMREIAVNLIPKQ